MPILLLHGTDDQTVPVSVSDRFAAARPDLVTYVRSDGVGHVGTQAADPQGYHRALERFLLQVLSRSGPGVGGG